MAEQHMCYNSVNTDDIILEAKGINMTFPGVKALTDVDFSLRRGQVVALLGENGAGKSTLIKILSGIYQPDSGSIEIEGRQVHFELPSESFAAGIGVIHQELNYVPTISIAENIFMGKLPLKHGFVDYKTMYSESTRILENVGLKLNPRQIIGTCSVAQKQLIEIAKILTANVKIMIFDEPTSALNDVETEYLFELIRKASRDGIGIIYISHKLDELYAIAQHVVVLRDGFVTGEFEVANTSRDQLIARMVGRKTKDMYPKYPCPIGEVIFSVTDLCTNQLKNISFETRKGEIFGIYGLMGSGHERIGAALFGQDIVLSGKICVNGEKVVINNPMDAIQAGIAYVPAERKTEGLVLNQSVMINATSARYSREKPFFLNFKRDKESTYKWIEKLRIKTPSPAALTESLSGGNQQKVVLAKWLELSPDVLILNGPTRGIDVGAKAEIYRILNDLCAEGKCVIMITSEMPELLAISDRIMVMFEGKVSGYLEVSQATQEKVVKLAIGG